MASLDRNQGHLSQVSACILLEDVSNLFG